MGEIIAGIEGMSCGHCAKEIHEALSGVGGVRSIHLSLEKASARVVFDESVAGVEQMAKALEAIGFKAVFSNS